MLQDHGHRRSLLTDGGAKIATHDAHQKIRILHVQGTIETEEMTGVGDFLLRGRLIDQKSRGVAREAYQEEDDGHHAPDDEDGMQQTSEQKCAHHFFSATPRKSMLSSGMGTKRSTRLLWA